MFLFALCLFACGSVAAGDRWDPIPPADLSADIPPAERDANAVVLFSRVDMRYIDWSSTKDCYRRTKIYTTKGADDAQKLGIEYPDFISVTRLAARVVHPDGSSTEYTAKDFQQTTVLKFGDVKWQSKRLVLPDLKVGDILEYKWREAWDGWSYFLQFYCQEVLPVRDYDLSVYIEGGRLNVAWYNLPAANADARGNTIRIRAANIPALQLEPDMLPEFNVRGVILVTFGGENKDQKEGWQYHAGWLNELGRSFTKPNGAIKTLATQLTAGASTPDEKLRRLYEYCQTKVVNIDYDESAESVAERKKLRDPRPPGDIAKKSRGGTVEINSLFAALARAAGFDSRLVAAASRETLVSPKITNGWNFVVPRFTAIKTDGATLFFSPGDRFVPYGELRWQDEGSEVMLSDKEYVVWDRTPSTKSAATQTRREATLKLDAEGALEGEVTLTLTGHAAIQWRNSAWKLSAEDQKKNVSEPVTARLPNAAVTDLRFEALDDPRRPLVIKYHLRVPDYCPPSGSRLLVVPNVFEIGTPSRFNNPSRVQPVLFPYSYEVHDRITLAMPDTGDLDRIDPPARIGDSDRWISHDVSFDYDPATRVLQYRRDHHLGTGGQMHVPTSNYETLKSVFESANKAATHAIVWALPAETASVAAANP